VPEGFIKFFLVRIVRKVEPCAGQWTVVVLGISAYINFCFR
jgi:hypothetical protein